MTRTQILYLHASTLLLTLTGAVFAFMKYAMKSEDDFAVVNHPLQPHMLSAHVVLAPFLVFGFGWIFASHVWPKLVFRDRRNRTSGIASLALIAPMTLSGYLMQISTNDTIRQAMAVAHWITSAIFVLAYVVHLVKPSAAEAVRSTPVDAESFDRVRALRQRRR
jgi:hypothetical protein